jgi:DNA-directed RNA polymerase subunit omega
VVASTEPTDSKFRLILIAAQRARQIQSGARPLIHTTARKPTRVAQEELRAGVLPYEVLLPSAEDGVAKEVASPQKERK